MPSGGILIHLFAGHIFNLTVLLQFRISLTSVLSVVREYDFPLFAHGYGRMTDKTGWTEPRRLRGSARVYGD